MPKWALAITGVVVCGLMTTLCGLLVYIFVGLEKKVEEMGDKFDRMSTQIVLLQAQVETQGKICRFPK